MRPPFPALLVLATLLTSGCAAGVAATVEPTGAERPGTTVEPSPAAPGPPPRPSAAPGLASRGPAELVYSVKTKKKVVFITIDDGLFMDPELRTFLDIEGIPITAFLTTGTVTDWSFWKDLAPVASMQNHSVRHPHLDRLSEAAQQQEICAANQQIVDETGQTPWMLRPPYGAFNAATLTAAGRCGLDWVVYWSVVMTDGRLMYQTADRSLKPGDIILGHFEESTRDDLRRVVKEVRSQGFKVARLEDYLRPHDWQQGDPAPAPAEGALSATSTESRAELIQ